MQIIKNSKLIKNLRNLLAIRPALTMIDSNKKNLSTSDAFFWRTDNNFKTIFQFTDIFKFFFNDNDSEAEIYFFDKKNKFIKQIKFSDLNLSNKLLIDKNFLNNIEDYGTFYIFHSSNKNNKSIIRNSCYTGYSQNNNPPSYVHGNTITALKNLNNNKLEFGLGGITYFKDNIYQVQNTFKNGITELMLMNPTKKNLKISINNEIVYLDTCSSMIKKFNNTEIIKIISKCYLLRPIIFSYQNNYLDVYHG